MSTYRKQITIAAAATESDALDYQELRFANDIVVYAPAALSGVNTVQVTAEKNPGAGDWRDLEDESGSAVTMTAGEARPINASAFYGLRLQTTVAPGADEVFDVVVNDHGP